MKIAESIQTGMRSAVFTSYAAGANAVEVCGERGGYIRLGRVSAAAFPGELALEEKHRRHFANDALSSEIESVNVIPFGCEYRIRRKWTLFDGVALLNCDINADNGGVIRDLELEPVTFPFAPSAVEFMVWGDSQMRRAENPDGVLYSGGEPVIMVRSIAADGRAAEFYAGDDFWRHRAAQKIEGAEAEFTLTASPDEVVLTRKVLHIPEECAVEKRPWRFKSLLAWCENIDAPLQEMSSETFTLDGCFAAAVPRRELRRIVRRSDGGKALIMKGDFPVICDDPAHLERSGKNPMEHGDLGELAADYLWANRELRKRGGAFMLDSRSGVFGKSAALLNMSQPLCELERI